MLSIFSVSLAGCGNKEEEKEEHPFCFHVDENPRDFICDLCGEELPEPTELEIISQPEDVEVELPKGCSFSVEVNNEKLVKSYMWQVYNGEIPEGGEGPFGARPEAIKEQWLDLKDCTSGHTKTYIKNSTFDRHDENKYRCKITDIDDNVIYSDEAYLTYSNPGFNDPMIKVGGYILLVGETLDLSKTELGTGSITYVSRTELKLSNVKYHNESPISDNIETGTDGIMVYDETFKEENFKVTLEGNNIIHNTYWDPDHNAGGIGLNFFFGDGFNAVVNIEGPGKLAITGGSHAIYYNGTINLSAELILNSIGSHYGTGIYAHNVILDGAKISGKVNGVVINNKNYSYELGKIFILNSSVVDVVVRPQHPSVGGTIAQGMVASGDFVINKSIVNIDMILSGEDFSESYPVVGVELIGSNESTMMVTNSLLSLSYRTDSSMDGLVMSAYGVMSRAGFVNSSVNISMVSPETTGVTGIASDGFTASNSEVHVECRGLGNVYGILTNERADYLNSNINVITESYDGTNSLGIMWTQNVYDNSRFIINTNDGIAFGTLRKTSTNKEVFDPSYTAKHIDNSKVKVYNFNDQVINQYSIYYPLTGKYNVIETIYSSSNTEAPASYLMMDIVK